MLGDIFGVKVGYRRVGAFRIASLIVLLFLFLYLLYWNPISVLSRVQLHIKIQVRKYPIMLSTP